MAKSMTPREAVEKWRSFCDSTTATWKGRERSWTDHITRTRAGYADEVQLVQPLVFRRFAAELLGWKVGVTLGAEQSGGSGGRPDFTPDDAVTHPFVFETKSTNYRVALNTGQEQVQRYLTLSRERVKTVVLTNLVGLKVCSLSPAEKVHTDYSINLLGLLEGPLDEAAKRPDAQRLANFLDTYRRRELTSEQKLQSARRAPAWEPLLNVTDASWLSERLDRVVIELTRDAQKKVKEGVLLDETRVPEFMREQILEELHELEWRIAENTEDLPERTLDEYIQAAASSNAGKALGQYIAHVAYFCATRMLLVRVFEDLGLLEPVLYNGGLDEWLERLQDGLPDVVSHAFRRAGESYPSLFDQQNTYTWYEPGEEPLTEVIYELANTYLGAIESDVLGRVYERLLERVDRKLLGQYYTPRDVIALIWDLVGVDPLAAEAEAEHRELRVLDVATGSGGFLVEACTRLRKRVIEQIENGAEIGTQDWATSVAHGLTGVEIQRFPAYLAELNLLIQLALIGREGEKVRVPPVGILCHNSLDTHNPDPERMPDRQPFEDQTRVRRFEHLCDPAPNELWFDAAIGNPPYIGEKVGSSLIAHTRTSTPYWEKYYATHLDYLYWFVILGISKLREGGRFGFITSEYWLRSTSASPLRRFLAQHTRIDKLVLFRDVRPFPDAPGHHSLVVVGERIVGPGDLPTDAEPAKGGKPTIYMLKSEAASDLKARKSAFERISGDQPSGGAMQRWAGPIAPNALLGDSWGEVILTPELFRRKRRIAELGKSALEDGVISEGVITGADRVRERDQTVLPNAVVDKINQTGHRGIFVLTREEEVGLGKLQTTEKASIRPTINTRHVLPYAAVPPEGTDRMLYLPCPDGASREPEKATKAFAKEMPAIHGHLKQFETLLRKKVEGYGVARPWWTIHNPRPVIESAEGTHPDWAGYAVISRWGNGGRLRVGLAPRNHVPQSSLHALIPTADVHAAYVVALFNSSPFQELADAIAPGHLGSDELRSFAVPILDPAAVTHLTSFGFELADLVSQLARHHGRKWPDLAASLSEDLTLSYLPLEAWVPEPGPPTTWGKLKDVPWISDISTPRAMARRATGLELSESLLGEEIHVLAGASQLSFVVDGEDPELRHALAAGLVAEIKRGMDLRDVLEYRLPIDGSELTASFDQDKAALLALADQYRAARQAVEDLLLEHLG